MNPQASDLTLLHLARELGAALAARGWRVSTAESCTGGGIAAAITEVAGSSEWFETGLITYANTSKTALLGVDPHVIEREGAVSEAVVAQMALGAKRLSGADLAVAVSGIAGPGGGSAEKPVGTVWLGWAGPQETTLCECYVYQGDRAQVRRQATVTALRGLLRLVRTP